MRGARRHARGVRLVAAALLLVLFASACGTRLPPEQVEAALAGSSQGAGGVGEGGGVAIDGVQAAGPAEETADASQGSSPAAEPASGGAGGGGEGCTSNPGATDAGVTGKRIRVGASYAESSLIPGQFRPAMDAIQVHVNMVNEAGGICGRVLDFHHHNDDLNAQRYGENVRHLVEQDKVFAMLGNLSAADSGACSYMNGQAPPKATPDVGTFALNYCRSQSKTFYSPMGSLKQGIYGCCVDWRYLKDRFGYRRPAVHFLDVEISKDQGLAVADALVRTLGLSGRGDIYQGEHSPAQFSYTGDVRDMQAAGVDAVWSSMDLNNNVKLLRAMCQQEWYPKVVHVEISAYDPQLIERVGKGCIRKQNVWMRSFHRAFSSPNDEIRRYVATLERYCPACRPTTFGLEGWLSAKLFVKVLRDVGPGLTRRAFYRAMDRVRNWDAGGTMGPNTPSRRLIYHCNVMIKVRPGGFTQERGFGCGKFYRTGDYSGGAVGP